MNAGKGDTPRPVHGPTYRRNHESIFGRFTDEQPTRGEVIDGHEYLGDGGWQSIETHEPELREENP